MQPRQITLETYDAPQTRDDKDYNFKQEVAQCCLIDPMPTLDRMSGNLDIPVGAIVRYILSRWASSGSAGLMEIGPRVVTQMTEVVDEAGSAGTDEAKVAAFHRLAPIISWLRVPLENSEWRPGGWASD